MPIQQISDSINQVNVNKNQSISQAQQKNVSPQKFKEISKINTNAKPSLENASAVQISTKAKEMNLAPISQDQIQKMQQIKSSIDNGTYSVDSKKIASGILKDAIKDSLQDNLQPKI